MGNIDALTICTNQWINNASPTIVIQRRTSIRQNKSIDEKKGSAKYPSWSTILHDRKCWIRTVFTEKKVRNRNVQRIAIYEQGVNLRSSRNRKMPSYLERNPCFQISLSIIKTGFESRRIRIPNCYSCKLHDFFHNRSFWQIACFGIIELLLNLKHPTN